MKRSSEKVGFDTEPGEKDERVDKWLYVLSPDDLFEHGTNIDFEKLRCHPFIYNVKCEQFINDVDRFSSDDEQ